MFARGGDVIYIAEYIKNILYFAIVREAKEIKSTQDTHYFCIDNELVYENYYNDFGPLNLGCVYKYCKLLNEKLNSYLNKQVIVHYASSDPKKAANAAYLMGCYGVLYLGLSTKDAIKPLTMNGLHTYRPFQDAVQGSSAYTITIHDCLKGIKKAQELGLFNFNDFNYEEYNHLDKVAGGDLNWIVPGNFLAFIGPVDFSVSLYHPPEMYIGYFLDNDVQIVIRLNKRLYDGNVFSNVGIMHHDLFFPDGSCPPHHIVLKFLQLSENVDGAIAVHCKAGLGRTGSLIGCYLIKHYGMTAREAIGWMRICRPGSVIGSQQGWLEQKEGWLLQQGKMFRKKRFNDVERLPTHEYGIYSMAKKILRSQPVFIEKATSTPPPIQRNMRLNPSPPPRPKASRFREAFDKTQKDDKWGISTPHSSMNEIINKRDQQERSRSVTRRGSGAGEPRNSNVPTVSSAKQPRGKGNSNPKSANTKARPKPNNDDAFVRSGRSGARPIPMSMSPVRTTIADNRNSQLKDKEAKIARYKNERVTLLNQSLTVTPHKVYRITPTRDKTPSTFSTAASQGSSRAAPAPRRRLGRSPSPSPTPSRVPERTRATNTPAANYRALSKDDSKISLKKALSKLKVLAPRDGSTGAHSFGAASLGARREAPAPPVQRAPRVRSDERNMATQGDLLNCIKFQRRLKSNNDIEKKFNKILNEKFSISQNTAVQRYADSVLKWSGNDSNSNTIKLRHRNTSPEKFVPSKSGLSPSRVSRPNEPKGKKFTSVHNSYY